MPGFEGGVARGESSGRGSGDAERAWAWGDRGRRADVWAEGEAGGESGTDMNLKNLFLSKPYVGA